MDLELDGQEVSVGNYSADLVLKEVSSGAVVVVENMYGQTDHDHIGKLITYAAGLDASYAVLLAEDFRPEHRSALNWLNSISTEDCGFFWTRSRNVAYRRFNSGAAVAGLMCSPTTGPRASERQRAGRTARVKRCIRRFWAEMQSSFSADSTDWAGRGKPSKEAWMPFKSRKGVQFIVTFCRPGNVPAFRSEAYIDTGDKESTADLYAALEARRTEIDAAFGKELEWSRLEKRRASRVSTYFPQPIGIEDEDQWPQARAWAVSALGGLRAAIEPVLDDL